MEQVSHAVADDSRPLRGWQRRAMVKYLAAEPRDFLALASPIPFVTYTPGADGAMRSQADHTSGHAEGLADGVVRPVVFLAYSGQARWGDSAGEEHAARLGEPLSAEQAARAWRTALDPAGQWMPAVIAAADQRLRQLREQGPDAGGVVIASDETAAPRPPCFRPGDRPVRAVTPTGRNREHLPAVGA